MTSRLTDTQVYDLMHAATNALGDKGGESDFGDFTLKSARRALFMLQMALVSNMENAKPPPQQETHKIDVMLTDPVYQALRRFVKNQNSVAGLGEHAAWMVGWFLSQIEELEYDQNVDQP